MVGEISKYLPKFSGLYYEPFLGGGAVFFHIQPERATISDSNAELINAYKVVRGELEGLVSELERYTSMELTKDLYYNVRDKTDPSDLTAVERAARFIFLNKTCYNGLYRVNSSGRFNVPFGKYERMPKLFELENLRAISRMLSEADIMIAHYEIPLYKASRGDFVYLDPPYCVSPGEENFTKYTKKEFTEDDHQHLAEVFKRLDRRGCLVMLSNSNVKLIRELYREFRDTTLVLKADRMINRVASNRTGFKELLILNYSKARSNLDAWVDENIRSPSR